MHFGRAIYCLSPSHDVLIVVSPIDAIMVCGIIVCAVFLLFLYFLYRSSQKAVITTGVIIAVILVGAGSDGTITLDAVQQTAVVHTVFFGYSQTYRYPLSSIAGACVAPSQQSDALRLVLQGGADLQLTPYNQMGGKGQAAAAINRFLQEHGGTGSPY